jgi:mannose-6-phosphate isomerase
MDEVLARVKTMLADAQIQIVDQDLQRPWGGFLVLDEAEIEAFAMTFFPALDLPDIEDRLPMSPKILLVAPHQRLSWQYHHRRGELWHVVEGPVGVIHGMGDEQGTVQTLEDEREISLAAGERHRLVGLDSWGVVAEIWQHTDAANPSNEEDIVRLADDYDREGK